MEITLNNLNLLEAAVLGTIVATTGVSVTAVVLISILFSLVTYKYVALLRLAAQEIMNLRSQISSHERKK